VRARVPVAAIPAVALLAGASAGLLVQDFPFILGFVALVASFAAAVWCWWTSRPLWLAAATGLTFFVGGALLSADAWRKAWRPPLRLVFEELAREVRREAETRGESPPEDDRASATLTGVLRADASVRPFGASLSLDVISPGQGGVLLTVGGSLAAERVGEWRAGRLVRLPAELRRPSRYLDPGVPDEERILARRGTTLVGSVKSAALVEVVAKGSRQSEAAAAIRAFVRRAITGSVGRWSTRSAAIVTAIVIGDRAGLDDEVERRLQEAGTYHVIAISGGNIAILAGLTLIGFRVAGLLGRVAMLTAVAGLMAYCYLVGGGASVNRATLMAIVYFAARAIDLRGPPINALALVAGLMVAAQPFAVADPGFLLTFGATLAIVIAVPLVPVRTMQPIVASAAAMLAASIAAELALLPIAAFLFSRVTIAGLVLNFAAIPLMAVAQIAGMVVVPATWVWPPLAMVPGWIAYLAAEGLVRSAGLVDLVPAVTWRVAPPGWIAIFIYYAGVSVAWALWRLGLQVLGSRHTSGFRLARWAAAGAAAASLVWIAAEPVGCTSPSSTSGRGMRRCCSSRRARRCSSMPEGFLAFRRSTSAIASSRRCFDEPEFGGSTPSR
jgi:ComEC/Rec2-related protein